MRKIFVLSCCLLLNVSLSSAQEKTAYLVSDAHLDTQWNWDIQTTLSQYIKATLEQNLTLMKHYPNYVFNFEGAVKYAWMKEYYGERWEELKQRISEGRWHLTGSGWDANETIICSPESWLRNITLGQTFYRREFGTESTDVFLPDCFGFPYYLPTAARHCGLIGFSSQKLAWRTNPFYDGGKRYPFNVGLWQGIDGSRIMMAHGYDYAKRWADEDLSRNTEVLQSVDDGKLGVAYRYYGTGDMGGSPTIESVRAVERGLRGNGPVKIISATSDALYKAYLPYENHPELPVFDGELPMDVHGNGCYTSQAAMKLYNRQNEHLGDAAERAAVAADFLGTQTYPIDEMTRNWQRMIWHQFHDDLTGTSIPKAYEYSWNDELITLSRFANVLQTSVTAIAKKMNTNVSGTPYILYNAEAFPVKQLAEVLLPNAAYDYTVSDDKGKKVASQVVTDSHGKARLIFDANLPATGYAVYSIRQSGRRRQASQVDSRPRTLENGIYRLKVDDNGDVVSIVDKRYGKEMIAPGKVLRLVVFDDCRSTNWPAWEILKATLDKEPVGIRDNVKIECVEDGAVRQTLCITKTYGESTIRQYISLNKSNMAERIDFRNEVDWHSLNALLKCEMPLNVSNEKASYDIGLGCVERGNNRDNSFEVYSHEWTDLTDKSGDYGVTILNDSRYGWDKPNDNTLRLSLLYSPQTGRGYSYQARQDFGYHEFTYSLVGHKDGLDKVKAVQQSTMLNSPVKAFVSEKHAGELGRAFSFVQSDNDNVVVRTLKHAEASNEYVIRLHEVSGKSAQQAHLTFPAAIVKAVEADGTEKTIGEASYAGQALNVKVPAFGLATYKVVLQGCKEETQADAAHMDLKYNRKCFSYNSFRSSANFEGGYSYAAELLPEDHIINADNITFRLGDYDAENGMSCHGDTIVLPEGKNYKHLYLLAASDKDDRNVTFSVNSKEQTHYLPYYTGFLGQWGHEGQTQGYLKPAQIGYIGTHRHAPQGDAYYEFAYMFRLKIDIPQGATKVVLPNDEHAVIFAATLSNDDEALPMASALFKTSNKVNQLPALAGENNVKHVNLLKGAKITSCTGFVNNRERPEYIIDGDTETKWCDVNDAPNIIDFDMGETKEISGWTMLNAGNETQTYVTRSCILMGRNSSSEDWKVIDLLDGNRANKVEREVKKTTARYIRLMVTGPTQQANMGTVRIYELQVY